MARSNWGLVALLFFAFALRIYHLDTVPLRGDEAFTVVHWVETPFTNDWFDLIKTEAHPPGAFLLYWVWDGLVGDSEFAIRFLPLLFNILGSAAVGVLARRWFGDWRLVMMVVLLWALNPFLVWHSQDARNYSMVTAMAPLSCYWLVRATEYRASSQTLRPWWPYILLVTTSIYVYFFEIFTLVVQVVFVLMARQRRIFLQAVKSWAVIGVLCIPVAVQIYWLRVVGDYQGTATEAQLPELFERFIPTLLFGDNSVSSLLGALLFFAFVAGLGYVIRAHRPWGWLLLSWIVVPLALIFVVSHGTSVFRPRYVIHMVPALILSAVGVSWVCGKQIRFGFLMPILIMAVIGGISTVELYDYYFNDPPKAPDWRGLTDYLKERTGPYDVVLIGEPDPAIEYYYRGPGTISYIPIDSGASGDVFEGFLQEYDSVYVLTGRHTGDATRFFQNNAQHIPGDSYPGIVQYRPWKIREREIKNQLVGQFGDVARLRGYTLLGRETLLLYWEALGTTATEHSVMLHIETDAGAPPVAVLDHGVAGSIISMTSWPIGYILRDPVPLPLELPDGRYWLRVGIYETDNPDSFLPVNESNLAYVVGPVILQSQ